MARIIAEAGVRLTVDGKGLAAELRGTIRKALEEAQRGQIELRSPLSKMADDADRDSNRVNDALGKVGRGLASIASGAASAALTGSKILLIGTAAVGALAGVTQLAVGIGGLVAAAGQAAGVVGLLPAAFAAFKASTAAIQLGLTGVSDAMSAIASGDGAAFQEALDNLSPAARDFARAVRDVKPAFDGIRLDVQESLFQGLSDVVRPLADTYLPIVGAAFQGIARQASIAARDTADFVLQGAQVQKVSVFGANLQQAFGNVAAALRPAVSALLDLTTTGSTFLPGLTASLGEFATQFAEKISAAARSGELAAFFQRSLDALSALGRIAGNVFAGIGNIFRTAASEGGGFLQRLEEITAKFEAFTASSDGQAAFGGFFESMRRVIDSLSPAFLTLVTVIGRDLLPILADMAVIIGPVLAPIFQVLGRLLQALRPLIQSLAGAFATALSALEPFFNALAKAIDGAMPTLGPLIQEIGSAFAQLFEALVPLAPLFVQLLEAVLPIIPPFIQMISEIIPEVIELIEALVPIIEAWASTWVDLLPVVTAIANFLLNVMVPIFQIVGAIIGGLVSIVGGALSGIFSLVTTILGAVGSFIAGVWEGIKTGVSNLWNAVGNFFSGGISGIISKVGGFVVSVIDKFKNMMQSARDAVASGISNIVGFFRELPGKIIGFFSNAASFLVNAGKQVIQGLINGLKNAAGAVFNYLKNLISDAIDSVLGIFGIASPSKVFTWIGEQVGAGLALGIANATSDVMDAAGAMANAAIDAADLSGMSVTPDVRVTRPDADVDPGALGVGAGGVVVQQTNIMRPGTDVPSFANTVLQRGFGDVLSGASTLGVRRSPVTAGVDDQWVTL